MNPLAVCLLLLTAASAVLPVSRTRADDTVNYSDPVRYYEAIAPGRKAVPRRRMARILGFVRLEPQGGVRASVPARIVVTDRPEAGIVFHAAEATGAAQG